MFILPHSSIEDPEVKENFEAIEEQLSSLRLNDGISEAEVKGTKARKVALFDSKSKLLGYIPVYKE